MTLSATFTGPSSSITLDGFWDGGRLEFSIDDGATWHDVLAGDGGAIPAGPDRFVRGGYTEDIEEREQFAPIINESGNGVTEAFRRYALPLIAGLAEYEVGDDGLPVYVRFARHMVDKKTGREYAV